MLRRLRHKLRMIEYHSARRERDAWSRAIDVAMVASLLLALPAAWIADKVVIRHDLAISLAGRFTTAADGPMRGWLLENETARPPSLSERPLGNFQLKVTDVRAGWPLLTSVERHPAQLDLDILAEPKPRPNAQLAEDSPIRAAIIDALQREGQDEAIAAWRLSHPETDHHSWGWIMGAGLWWLMLTFASIVSLRVMRFITLWATGRKRGRQAMRRAEGRCVHCGYDLRGLEWSERCPECGEIAW